MSAGKVRLHTGELVSSRTLSETVGQLEGLASASLLDFEKLHLNVELYGTNLHRQSTHTRELRARGYSFIGMDGSLTAEQVAIVRASMRYRKGQAIWINPVKGE